MREYIVDSLENTCVNEKNDPIKESKITDFGQSVRFKLENN